MARMQKMPMPKVPARGSITDKMKKKPMPVRPMPKQVGGNVLDQLRKLGPAGPRNKKAVPGYAVGKAVGNAANKQKMQKAGPSKLNKLQSMFQAGPKGGRPGTNKGGGKLPNFKGVMAPRKPIKKPITRPVQPRRSR